MVTQIATAQAQHNTEPLRPFMNVVSAEWCKMITQRSSHMLVLLAAIISIGVTALTMWGIGLTWNDMPEADRASFMPLETSMIGVFFAGIISLVIAANTVTNEYSSGMIRQSMTVTPDRKLVVLAKMAVVTIYLLLPLFVITFCSIWVGQLVFGAYGVPTVDVFGSDIVDVFWLAMSGLYYPILTVGIGFLMRSSASTITLVMLSMFFPALFGGLLPRSIQENVLAYLPGNAVDALVMGHRNPDYAQYLDKPLAAVVTVAWIALITGFAIWQVNRRDVG